MSASAVAPALARVETRLLGLPHLESVIARSEIGDAPADALQFAQLVHEATAHQRENGSWNDSLGETAELLLRLGELPPVNDAVKAAARRALLWLRSRQRAAGAFGEACSADRHAAGICHHYATGFFSPGPRTESLAGYSLSSGATFVSDDDARLGLSALALRALLRFQPPCLDDMLQIDALARITSMSFHDHAPVCTTAAVSALATLTRAPRSAGTESVTHEALRRVAGLQRADGSWPGAEPFQVVDMLLLASRAGYGSAAVDGAIACTAAMLILQQQPDGSWGKDAAPFRLLTGWRTLRHVAQNGL